MSTTTATTTTGSGPITAENMLSLFPDIDTTSTALEGHDEEQIRLMDEVCIVLDENDLPIGTASKKLCQSTSIYLPAYLPLVMMRAQVHAATNINSPLWATS